MNKTNGERAQNECFHEPPMRTDGCRTAAGMTEETMIAMDPPAQEETPISARLFTETEMAERVAAARAKWESESAAAAESVRSAAFAEGQADARTAAMEEITALRAALHTAETAAARRETEIRCGRMLRERSLGEEMASILLAPGETEVPDEVLLTRVEALSGAVEAAALRAIRKRASGILPGTGDAAPLSGQFIRETPVAKLAEMLG